jgi:hypothetical protein
LPTKITTSAIDSFFQKTKIWDISVLLTVWLFCCLTCNGYGIAHGLYYAWIASFLLIGAAFFRARKNFGYEISKFEVLTIAPGILLISLGAWYFLASLFHGQQMAGLKYLFKFSVIGITYFSLLILNFKTREIRNTFAIVAFLNVIPFLLYFVPGAEQAGIAELTFGGRMVSILNPYGTLWKTGIYLAIFSIWQVYLQPSSKGILLLGMGLLLCALDGSRVGLLVIVIAMGILFYFSILQSKIKNYIQTGSLVAFLVFVVPMLWLKKPAFVDRYVKALLVALGYNPNVMPEYNEEIRVKMFLVIQDIIHNARFFGHGIYTTGLKSGEGFQSLHIAYFQILGDVGYGGFLIFCALIFLPFFKRKKLITAITIEPKLWPLGVISLVWFVVFIFHPISTEMYEWVGFMLATSTVTRFIQERKKLGLSEKQVI